MERRNSAIIESIDNDKQWLYHYASHQGLLGILGGERISIRATAKRRTEGLVYTLHKEILSYMPTLEWPSIRSIFLV